jgi:hypothetical protein
VKLERLIPSVRDLAGWGARGERRDAETIPFSSIAQLAGLNADEQSVAASAILEYQLVWKEVVALLQLRRRSGRPVDECVAEITRLRPQVERRHVFIGGVDDDLAQALAGLTQEKRDRIMACAEHSGYLTGVSILGSRLGATSFTVVTSRSLSEELGVPAETVEQELMISLRGCVANA